MAREYVEWVRDGCKKALLLGYAKRAIKVSFRFHERQLKIICVLENYYINLYHIYYSCLESSGGNGVILKLMKNCYSR